MKKAIFRELDLYGDDLSGHCTRFAYRLMNLCVKAEEVSLLPVEALIDGDLQKLEDCCTLGKKDDYTFMIVPNFKEDLTAIAQGVMLEHPEFKQETGSQTLDTVDEEGQPAQEEINYLLLTMPEVDNDRYKLLKNTTDVLYNECKAAMEAANTKADAKLAPLTVGESDADLKKLKKVRDKVNDQWTEHREKVYHDKLQEIEDAHNMWMADRVEEALDNFEDEDAHNAGEGFSMKAFYQNGDE